LSDSNFYSLVFMTSAKRSRGIILFAHGSRDELWRRPIEAVAEQIKQMSAQTAVSCAYLELTEPDLATTVETMRQQSIIEIDIVPMFLGVGRHAREDLPELVRQLQLTYPNMTFILRRAIGEEHRLTQAMAEIALNPA
jgi:sirohydrochlorin cobaltochelatase